MSAPELTRPVLLEGQSLLPDGAGGYAPGWAELGRLWAEFRPGPARGPGSDAARASRVTHLVTVRGAPPGSPARPRPGQRLRDGLRLFRILSVAEADPSGRFLILRTEELQ
jgi:head-tail adaptor